MDSQYLQRQRFLLQKRVRRLNSCGHQLFHSSFVQFWNYVCEHPLYSGIFAKLEAEAPLHLEDIESLTKNRNGIPIFEREEQSRNFTFRLLQYCAAQPIEGAQELEVSVGRVINRAREHNVALDAFRETYLEPLYEFLDESLDQHAAVLSLLLKYKKKVEWFERKQVSELAARGERVLAEHLYAYLFDQGLDFHIEPQSASGEADLVASELVLDAKVFDGGGWRNVAYVKSGIHQLLTYTRDFNQSVGYLVIFRTCPADLQFSFERADSLVPFVSIGGKTLYLLVVDICDYGVSASKRGILKAYQLDGQDLITHLEEPSTSMIDMPSL